MDTPDTSFSQDQPLGKVALRLTRHAIHIPTQFFVPYEGNDPQVQADFGGGFAPSYGSGIAFRERLDDGTLLFYCLTDRGPNGDGPQVPQPDGDGHMDSKLFPAPGFTPSIGLLRVDRHGARVEASTPIRISADLPASGLPLPPGALGNSAEVPLHDSLRFEPGAGAGFHPGGIDSEAIAFDAARGVLWIADEYGPFLMQVDPASGMLLARYAPGAGLPPILARRRANRGMEGMTLDPQTGRIHAFLQSPLTDPGSKDTERYARFLRWIEFDPASGSTVRMLAYPLAPADFSDGRTGHAKLGDVAAIGDGKFIVIEQGEGADGTIFNHLMLLETAGASDIGRADFNPDTPDLEQSSLRGEPVNGADWRAVVPMKKSRLLDLNALGWHAEKAEGIALVDGRTLAITNDSDFGMKTRVYDAQGAEVDEDVTAFKVDSSGAIEGGARRVVRVAPHDADEGVLSIWLLEFAQPLASYGSAIRSCGPLSAPGN